MIKSLLEEENQPEAKSEIEENPPSHSTLKNFPETDAEQTTANISKLNTEQTPANSFDSPDSEVVFNFRMEETPPKTDDKPMFQTNFKPESPAETIRKSGLAYAAGITLFGSIAFLLIIGWFADLLFGTSPWGIVVGIVLGSIVGFLQFFRITSQILKDKE
jgi:F0F1-type ATP synthase assembly protein I